MRLTLKLALGLVLAILPVIVVSSGLRVSREIAAVDLDARTDDALLARTIAGATTAVWRTAGETEARLLVASAQPSTDPHAPTIRWTWDDVPANDRPVVVDSDGSTLTSVAVTTPSGRRGAIEVARPDAAEDSFVRHTIRQAALATAAVVGLCGVLALGLGAIFVGAPVRRLVARTRAIGAGDFTTRVLLPQRDELGYLAAEINAMSAQLSQSREHVRRADRLATVGKLAAGIAHELGTPLNVISGHAQLITADHTADSAAYEHATIVVQQTHRVAAIIRQLLDFARRGTPRRTAAVLAPVIADTVHLLQPLADARRATIALELDEVDVRCHVDAGQIQQAITNLVVNGLQALGEDKHLVVRLSTCRLAAPHTGEFARIDVEDRGAGIAADVLPHIFEPFFTTKGVGEGTGLGLSVTYGIVRDHDGWLDVHSRLGAGTQFAIYLPLTTERKASS